MQQRYEVTDAPRPDNTAMIPWPTVTDEAPRCWRCRRRLAAFLTRPWELICQKCNAVNLSPPIS